MKKSFDRSSNSNNALQIRFKARDKDSPRPKEYARVSENNARVYLSSV
jgi:hypothetical protein